jgi:hypothetical protein
MNCGTWLLEPFRPHTALTRRGRRAWVCRSHTGRTAPGRRVHPTPHQPTYLDMWMWLSVRTFGMSGSQDMRIWFAPSRMGNLGRLACKGGLGPVWYFRPICASCRWLSCDSWSGTSSPKEDEGSRGCRQVWRSPVGPDRALPGGDCSLPEGPPGHRRHEKSPKWTRDGLVRFRRFARICHKATGQLFGTGSAHVTAEANTTSAQGPVVESTASTGE